MTERTPLTAEFANIKRRKVSADFSGGDIISDAGGAVLLYLVNPFDMIPDKDAQRGYLDDLFMLELGLSQFGEELDAFVTSCSAPHD